MAPFTNENLDLLRSYVEPVLGKTEREWSWDTVGRYMDSLLQARPSENVATYVGHGTLRIAVMGFDDRPASSNELGRMKHLLEEGLRAGAIGLSLGLMYAPGSYTSREELVELCSVLPKYEGLLAAHIRGEGNSLIPSIEEVIWIAERSGVPLQISHLKAAGRSNWSSVIHAMEVMEEARSRGSTLPAMSTPILRDPPSGTGSEEPQSGQLSPFSCAIRAARRFCWSERRGLLTTS